MICREELLRWLRYEPDSGIFYWRERPAKSRAQAGSPAGSINRTRTGQRRVLWVQGKRIYAARAAYIYVHGEIPETVLVDHIDGDCLNDRIDNLRLAGAAQNTWNRVQREGSLYKLGVGKGERGRYKARIQLPDGSRFNLGTWATEEEAHAAYMGAAAILHSAFWVGHRVSVGPTDMASEPVNEKRTASRESQGKSTDPS